MKNSFLLLMVGLLGLNSLFAQVVTDTIYSDTTFTLAGSPYTMTHNLQLGDDVKATIEPGVTIYLSPATGFILGEDAKVFMNGTATDSIYLLPTPGDTAWGGVWNEISFFFTGGVLEATYVHADGAEVMGGGGIDEILIEDSYLENGSMIVDHSAISPAYNPSVEAIRSKFINYDQGFNGVLGNPTIGSCWFENIEGVVVTGYQFDLETSVTGCTFKNVGKAIEYGNINNLYVGNCTFIDCDSAISTLFGARNLEFTLQINNCTFEDNELAVAYCGNKQDMLQIFYGFSFANSHFCNNDIDIRVYSSDTLDLTIAQNCFCDQDSVLSNVAVQSGVSNNLIFPPIDLECVPDMVYSGDTDHDQDCLMDDLFPIGIHYGKTGPLRTNASLNWEPQPGNDWTDTLANGRNIKHVDTDGNGMIDLADTLAINLNYGKTHQNLRPGSSLAGGVPLYFDQLPANVPPGTTLAIPIMLGKMDSMANDIYGLSFRMGYDSLIINNATFRPTNSWLGTPGTDLLVMDRTEFNTVDVGMVRYDQNNQNGYGQIGELELEFGLNLPDSLELVLNWSAVCAISLDETELEVGGQDASVTVATTVGLELGRLQGLELFPNPSQGKLNLHSETPIQGMIRLYDLQGRMIFKNPVQGQSWQGDVSLIPSGLYLVALQTKNGRWNQMVHIQP